MTNKSGTKALSRVIISGGGTGGHIFPAIAIANALRRRFPNVEILFVGAEGRMEMERVPASGYQIEGLKVSGFDRRHLWRNVKVLWQLQQSLRKARRIVKNFAPDVVIGVGGYASGPTLKAAQRLGIPTIVQEQNSFPGVTNKLLADKAAAVCVAYEGLEKYFPKEKIRLTGNPVRHSLVHCNLTSIRAKEQLGFPPDKPLVLVVGGSLGARTINRAVGAGLSTITDSGRVSLLWQTGRQGIDAARKAADGIPAVRVEPFISEMDVAYRAADLVVARAGAGTISELQLLGKAAILVPSPNVAEDHQTKNAMALVARGAARMISDSDAPAKLPAEVAALIANPTALNLLAVKSREMALENSDERIVDEVVKAINGN